MNWEPLIYVGAGLILAFLHNYFMQRGKNEAMKRDITDLTKKVEEVKSLFEFKSHTELSLWDGRRNALLSYYKSFNLWWEEMKHAGEYIKVNKPYDKMEHLQKLYDRRLATHLGFYDVFFFVSDKKIIDSMLRLMKALKKRHDDTVDKIRKFDGGEDIENIFGSIDAVSDNSQSFIDALVEYGVTAFKHLKDQEEELPTKQ